MSWLKKLFGSTKKPEAEKAISLGQEKVGIPQRETIDAIYAEIQNQNWKDFKYDKIEYYMERMLYSNLMSILQKALPDSKLEKLDPNRVRVINLLLLRDHCRHNADIIRPLTRDNWIDPLFDKLFFHFNIPADYKRGFENKFDLESFNPEWAVKISEPLGLESHKLFMSHSAIVTGAREEQ
jgi:hypothetical protein